MIDVDVAGHVAVDVIHLLAELIENATAFTAHHEGPDRRAGRAPRLRDRDRGPRPRHERRGAHPGQRAPGQPAGDRLRPVPGAWAVRGRATGPAPRYQGAAAPLLVRRGDRPDPAAPRPAGLAKGAQGDAGAGGRRLGRAELPSPERRGSNGAAAAVEAEPAPSGDRLPIFEAARSDWFVPSRRSRPRCRSAGASTSANADGGPLPGRPAIPPAAWPWRSTSRGPSDHPWRRAGCRRAAAGARGTSDHRPEPVRVADDDAPLYRAERARCATTLRPRPRRRRSRRPTGRLSPRPPPGAGPRPPRQRPTRVSG